MASAPDTATDLVVTLSNLKDRGIPLASVELMIDISNGPEPQYVAATLEFVRDETTGAKWLVVRPKPAGV
jgi:hypothetical protein